MRDINRLDKFYDELKEIHKKNFPERSEKMNREILFRGKVKLPDNYRGHNLSHRNGDWVYGLMNSNESIRGIFVDTSTIGQYTGLTDKNGTKIFEGDIVKTNQYQRSIGTDTFTIEFVEGNYYLCHKRCTVWTLRSFIEEIEVIGNKYDNLELVEK